MKIFKRGKNWSYMVEIEKDTETGNRRKFITKGGFRTKAQAVADLQQFLNRPLKDTNLLTWTLEEVKSFLTESKKGKHYIAFYLSITTGMRKRELLGLKWCDIDFDKKIINVQRVVCESVTVENKNIRQIQKSRQIPIRDNDIVELLAHKELQKKFKSHYADKYNDQDLVISNVYGNVLNPKVLYYEMKKICKVLNITYIKFHGMRHTFAKLLISNGVDILKLSRLLGHINPIHTRSMYKDFYKL